MTLIAGHAVGVSTDQSIEGPEQPVVFVSYSHDNDDHRRRVLRLVEILRHFGVHARIDRYREVPPPPSWAAWMHHEIEEADYVIVVCTKTYERRVLGREESGKGLGSRWEGSIITQEVYESTSERFIPVIFNEADSAHVPYFLRGTTHYLIDLDSKSGIESLLRHIFEEPEITPTEIGARPTFPLNVDDSDTEPDPEWAPNRPRPASAATAEGLDHASIDIMRGCDAIANGQPADVALLSLRESLDSFARAMTVQTGTECRATVMGLELEGLEQTANLWVYSIATSSSSTKVPQRTSQRHLIADDLQLSYSLSTNYSAVIDPDTSVAEPIINQHFQPVFCKSSMAWPIIRPSPAGEPRNDRTVLGFLCLDANRTQAFSGARDEATGWLYAALLSFLLVAMHNQIS